jgi:hypothetical protein
MEAYNSKENKCVAENNMKNLEESKEIVSIMTNQQSSKPKLKLKRPDQIHTNMPCFFPG